MKRFTINNKTYSSVAFDFNLVCDLEDNGISLSDIQKKPLSFTRTYLAICANRDLDFAGKEIEQHLVSGGTLDDILSVMSYEMEKSDFFRNLSKTEKENAGTSKAKKVE